MNLVVNKVVKLEHVDVADRCLLLHHFPGSTISQEGLTFFRQIRFTQSFSHFLFRSSIKHRTDRSVSKLAGGPAKVRFQNLPHVHATGNAQRIQNDVDGRSIFKVRHIFDRQHLGNHTLITVASSHFVADGDVAFRGHIDFHHLQNAAWQFVATLHTVQAMIFFVDHHFDSRPFFLNQLSSRCLFLGTTDVQPLEIAEESSSKLGDRLFVFQSSHVTTIGICQSIPQFCFHGLCERAEDFGDSGVALLLGLLQLVFELLALNVRQAHSSRKSLGVNHDPADTTRHLQ